MQESIHMVYFQVNSGIGDTYTNRGHVQKKEIHDILSLCSTLLVDAKDNQSPAHSQELINFYNLVRIEPLFQQICHNDFDKFINYQNCFPNLSLSKDRH